MTSLNELLSVAESVENLAAALYDRYQKAFASDEEAAFLFYRLFVEEKSHVSLVRYLDLLAKHGKGRFDGIQLEVQPLKSILAHIEAELARPLPFTLEEAVRNALDLEVVLGESYQKTRLAAVGPAAERLVESLSEKGHAEVLIQFAKQRGILADHARHRNRV